LEVADMDRAVHFWSDVLGFPIVEQWKWEPGVPGYQAEQFISRKHPYVWATWLYIGGNTRLGLWLPKKWTQEEREIESKPVTSWPFPNLYDQGGKHVHFALYIEENDFAGTNAGYDSQYSRLQHGSGHQNNLLALFVDCVP
jgi:catechol 2,3-dioxygenase-like lactoylglutathione lyase family enzyme